MFPKMAPDDEDLKFHTVESVKMESYQIFRVQEKEDWRQRLDLCDFRKSK